MAEIRRGGDRPDRLNHWRLICASLGVRVIGVSIEIKAHKHGQTVWLPSPLSGGHRVTSSLRTRERKQNFFRHVYTLDSHNFPLK